MNSKTMIQESMQKAQRLLLASGWEQEVHEEDSKAIRAIINPIPPWGPPICWLLNGVYIYIYIYIYI